MNTIKINHHKQMESLFIQLILLLESSTWIKSVRCVSNLCSIPLTPMVRLNIEVLHVHRLSLPSGVGVVKQGEPNQLQK